MNENSKINEQNELNEEENLTKEEMKFIELIKLDDYEGIKFMLNINLPLKKIWEYKTQEDDNSSILHLSILYNNTKIISRIINYSKHYLTEIELK